MRHTPRRDLIRRPTGLLLAVACLALAAWAVTALTSGQMKDVPTVVGVAAGLLTVAGAAGKLIKSPDVDLTQAAGNLAAAVETGELAQRVQLLGGDNEPIDVAFRFCAAPSRVAVGAADAGTLREITDYYRRLQPRRLLITGAAGAGKTVLALELMLSLLEQRQPDEPVPVRLALAGWDVTQPLDDWLTNELVDSYQLSTAAARRLVEQRRVLPVLDGLDEMAVQGSQTGSSRAADAVAALNRYQAGRQKAPLVLTCRTTTYDALATTTRLRDAVRIEVEPVGADQAQAFVTARVLDPQQWQPVLDSARSRPQGAAAHVLSTPWLLTLAVTVYEADGDPTELLRFKDAETLRGHLLHRFVPAATELHAGADKHAYRPEQVERWLALLATYLNDNTRAPRTLRGQLLSGTDLVLHRLWPLAGTRTRILDTVISGIAGLLLIRTLLSVSGLNFAALGVSGPVNVLVAVLTVSWIVAASRVAWPTPKGIDPGRLRTPIGRRAVIRPLAFGFAVALTAALAIFLPMLPTIAALQSSFPRLHFGAPDALVALLTLLLPIGLIGGLAYGLRLNLETTVSGGKSLRPTDLVQVDLRAGVLVGCLAGGAMALTTTISLVVQHPYFGVDFFLGLLARFALGGGILAIFFGPIWAGAWRRYLATLLCTRGRLPWRLGHFLAWAYDAGLLRIAGIAYQFRHRELQDHLAEHQ